MIDLSGAYVGGHRSMVPMMIAALFVQVAAVSSPGVTVAVTLSSVSITAVGGLVFKAGEWRGEHKALQQKVSEQYTQLQASLENRFNELREDIRDMRK